MNLDVNIAIELSYIAYSIVGIFLLIQLYYILFVYTKLSLYKISELPEDNQDYPPVSVLICARNEQENLRQFLPAILEQDYPSFEVIVIDDSSDDETLPVLQTFQRQYQHLHIVEIKEHIHLKHNKKFALSLGIKSAKYEHLVMTDADCQPQSNLWLKHIACAYKPSTEIVLGYSPYFKMNGFLNKLIRFETSHTAMSYLSYALKHNAYMGVGRNLSYLKSLFFKSKGFTSHMHIKSGDDDLFVNQNANATNVQLAIHPQAHLYSMPKESWKSYYKQKARHAGASVAYKKSHQRMLGTQLVSAILFYSSLIVATILFPSYWYIALGLYVSRLIAQYAVFSGIYRKLDVRDLLLWLPLLDAFFYFYICFNGIFNRKKKIKSWK